MSRSAYLYDHGIQTQDGRSSSAITGTSNGTRNLFRTVGGERTKDMADEDLVRDWVIRSEKRLRVLRSERTAI